MLLVFLCCTRALCGALVDLSGAPKTKQNLPPKMTRPKHHSVFLRVHPLSRTLSLSREYVCPSRTRVPLNLSRRLLGGSHRTSPERDRGWVSSNTFEVTASFWGEILTFTDYNSCLRGLGLGAKCTEF